MHSMMISNVNSNIVIKPATSETHIKSTPLFYFKLSVIISKQISGKNQISVVS